ncbi:hypothetical protein PVAP13_8NG233100 [Panicum virgatum]|nr:hypothetical protein PVAP13_8NG233100 [Panicum virgatum]
MLLKESGCGRWRHSRHALTSSPSTTTCWPPPTPWRRPRSPWLEESATARRRGSRRPPWRIAAARAPARGATMVRNEHSASLAAVARAPVQGATVARSNWCRSFLILSLPTVAIIFLVHIQLKLHCEAFLHQPQASFPGPCWTLMPLEALVGELHDGSGGGLQP